MKNWHFSEKRKAKHRHDFCQKKKQKTEIAN